ncbi:integrase [Staphylococcus pasteuri]|nr:integrase [Staphylococcus pasteuri]
MSVRKQTNGKWYYDFGYESKRYKKKGFKTKREATQAESIAKNKVMKGFIINNKTSFIEYYNDWIKVNKEDVVTDKAYATFKNAINQFKAFLEKENLSDVILSDLNTTFYRKFIKWYGSNHSTETVRKIHNCLKQSIDDAIQEGLIHKDPTYKVVVKGTIPAQREEEKFMSIENFKALKQYVTNIPTQSYVFIYLLIITGGRFGEVQKLCTSDLDFKNNTIHLPGTKTETSDRTVDVPATDMKILKSTLANMPISLSTQLFNTGVSLITHNAVSKVLQKFCIENAIGKYTLHSIRHTHYSYLLHNDVSIYYISKRLGHKNIKTTMDVYSHLLDEIEQKEKQKAVNALENMTGNVI